MMRLATLLLLCVVCACVPRAAREPPIDTETVEQALLRHLVASEQPPRERVACLGYGTRERDGWTSNDIPPDVLGRFTGIATAVAPASECRLRDPLGGMIHVPSGRDAIRYRVMLVEWRGANRAELIGEWYYHSLGGQSCRYTARRAGRAWHFVVAESNCVVS